MSGPLGVEDLVKSERKDAYILKTLENVGIGETSAEDAINLFQAALRSSENGSVVASAISVAASLYSIQTPELPEAVALVIQRLAKSNANVKVELLKTIPDPKAAGLLPDTADLPKKLRVINTNVNFRQHKFNILSEESEGYSKFLFAVLHSQDHVKSLIGIFSLDPNRCVDLLVDVVEYELRSVDTLESTPRLDYLKRTLGELNTTKLPQLLGFKLRDTTAPLKAMTWLVVNQIITVSAVLPYLPDDSHMFAKLLHDLYQTRVQQDQKRLQSLGRVHLSSTLETDQVAEEGTDFKPLQDLLLTKWIFCFLELDCFESIQTLGVDWSAFVVLFPKAGVAILDWVAQKIPSSSPWNEIMNVDVDLSAIADTLELVRESGCIRERPDLYCKLCRLLQRSSDPNSASIDFLKSFLVPSLSAMEVNPSLCLELWAVMKDLPYQVRYSIYDAWKNDDSLWLKQAQLEVTKDAKYSLKRLSKDTIRDISRAIAKCCHRHPLIVFTTILGQIESYDNLVQVMVDACRFVTPLGLDVLGYCILQRLTAAHRDRLKENGVNVSQWLQSLEAFVGAFYKRFYYIEFQGLVKYLLGRLQEGQVMELGILKNLVKTAGGWSFADYGSVASLSSSQLEGRAGSTLLQRETMAFGIVEDIRWEASDQVRRVLSNDGVSLLILLAQVRHQIIFSDDDKPVKLIGNLVDSCHSVMALILDFLTRRGDSLQSYAKALPALGALVQDYKIDAPIAWMLCRPLVRAASAADDDSGALKAFQPTDKTRSLYKAMLPETAWNHLTSDLFEVFYAHSLQDIFCPDGIYTLEIARLSKEVERLTQRKSQQTNVQDDDELQRIQKVVEELRKDQGDQQKRVKQFCEQLQAKSNGFFVSDEVSAQSAMSFFARCVYPRCMQGPDDALYCARFIQLLHQNDTKGFGTLHFLDAMIVALSRSLFGLTESEAACVSILLFETWKLISKWRYDDSIFASEVEGKPGSFMVFKEEGGECLRALSREEFETLYNKWHAAIGATCLGCLKSSEYMHLRNCLVVLTRMVVVYPTRPRFANKLIKALEPLQEESNSLADIRASAQAYNMQLIKARDDGVWKEEDAATIKARVARGEAAAAERHKKAEEQMAEIQRDSEKITEEIGGWDSRDRSRGRGGPPHGGDRIDQGDRRRRPVDDRHPVSSRVAPPPPNRDTLPSRQSQGDRWQRDRGPGTVGPTPAEAQRRRDENTRNLDGRWQRAASPGSGRKRSRPASPAEQGESREEAHPSKRTRADTDEMEGGRSGGGGGYRRRDTSRR